ncbi:MAG: fimbrial protein [Bacteroidales bacterium]
MKTNHYILFFTLLLLGYACTDNITSEIIGPEAGLPATASFSFKASSNEQLTRAVASDADEKKIHNLYVLVFDTEGKRTSGQFFNTDELKNNKLTLLTHSGRKHVYGIANLNLDIMEMEVRALDAVGTESELQQLNSRLLQNTVSRGNSFLMSGCIEDETGKVANVDIKEGDNGLLGTISLSRVDSKISFIITTTEGVTFTAKDWRVMNVPKKVSLFSQTTKDRFQNQEDYFNTNWYNIEGEGALKGKTFGFYILENTHTPKALIPSGLELLKQYNYRELQEKIPVTGKPNQTVVNGAFIYAPARSSYVQLRGVLTYKNSAQVDIIADVVYTIHLGYRSYNDIPDANDYDAIRNSHYTYHITIKSAENIQLEVDKKVENQPGAEGAVIQGNATYSFDAHYEAQSITFSASSIVNNLDWYVKTPFSEGFSKDIPKDKDWILFKLNETYEVNIGNGNGTNKEVVTYYYDNLARFSGEQYRFIGDDLNHFKSNKSMLLTVDQLLSILKQCKERYNSMDNNIENHLFGFDGNIKFTAFINENYYENNPEDTNDKSVDLWKQFVNQPERILNILSEQAFSPDGNSMMTRSVISFRQASIQTMYNTELGADRLLTAWGSEMIQDKTQYSFGNVTKSPTNTRNGRQNCITLWGVDGNTYWDTYINSSDGTLKDYYRNAQFACLRLNRDNNGNGKIDKDEIRWYLTSIDQLTDLWIGENSFDPAARLYDKTEWVHADQWYVSSSFSAANDPTVLWSSEGSSIGPSSRIDKTKLYYRSARNLGNVAEGDTPQDFANYDRNTGIISLDALNYKSIRGYPAVTELRRHHEREADNMPRRRFEVQKGSVAMGIDWPEMQTLVDSPNSPIKKLGTGWRMPNQRELALMQSRIGNDGNWQSDNHMSRTRFSLNPINGTRYGFSVSYNNYNLYLINSNNDRGNVRCVRDLE